MLLAFVNALLMDKNISGHLLLSLNLMSILYAGLRYLCVMYLLFTGEITFFQIYLATYFLN